MNHNSVRSKGKKNGAAKAAPKTYHARR